MSSHGFHPFGGHVSRRFKEGHLAPEDAYLSYYDVRLTKDDYDTMKDDWLTDNAIAFWQEYLEHEQLPRYPNAHIVLLRPSMTFLLNQTQDPASLRSALPDFSKTTHVFMPINDNRSPTQAEGGSHWTLLVVSIIDGVAFHYDSLRPSNHWFAGRAADQLSQLLGKPLRLVEMEGSPQQSNGSDCGVYVCLAMKFLLLERLLTGNTDGKISMSMDGMNVDASTGRKDMIRKVDEFRQQGRRSSSRSRSPFTSSSRHSDSKSPPRVGD